MNMFSFRAYNTNKKNEKKKTLALQLSLDTRSFDLTDINTQTEMCTLI